MRGRKKEVVRNLVMVMVRGSRVVRGEERGSDIGRGCGKVLITVRGESEGEKQGGVAWRV